MYLYRFYFYYFMHPKKNLSEEEGLKVKYVRYIDVI